MVDTVISVNGLSKKFCRALRRSMFYGAVDALRSMVGFSYHGDQLRRDEFWALRQVSFDVSRGEKIGFLGVNGSGKSTLLRLISGIFPPDGGSISVSGSIGALIAVGVGFHPHMTGRENIFLNGTILGMSRKELEAKLDSIIEFAEIGDFIDAPVSTYSSGMTVRLGFSVAIHRVPDIMLVDEVLAVGDLAFQLKCQKKLSEYRQRGGTFVIVSHNMQMIRNTCDRVIWLDHGEVVDEGDVYAVCDRYENALLDRAKQGYDKRGVKNVMSYDDSVHIDGLDFLDAEGRPVEAVPAGDPLRVRIRTRAARRVSKPIVTLAMVNSKGNVIFEIYSHRDLERMPPLEGEGATEVVLEQLTLKPDVYFVSVTLSEDDILNKLEWHEKSYLLRVTNDKYPVNQGLVYPHPKWLFEPRP